MQNIFDGVDDDIRSMSSAEMDAEFEAICDELQKDAGDVNVRELFTMMALVGCTEDDMLAPLARITDGEC